MKIKQIANELDKLVKSLDDIVLNKENKKSILKEIINNLLIDLAESKKKYLRMESKNNNLKIENLKLKNRINTFLQFDLHQMQTKLD